MKITVYNDGFHCFELEGDIKLTRYDERTQDFEIVANRKGLKLDGQDISYGDVDEETLEWIEDYPISEIEIGDKMIVPVWKPNRWGEPASFNLFQVVNIIVDEIFIAAQAGGTEEEVYNRYRPYIDKRTGEPTNNKTYKERVEEIRKFHEELEKTTPEETFQRFLSKHNMDEDEIHPDEIAKQLFE